MSMKKYMCRIAIAAFILCGACNIGTINVKAYAGHSSSEANGTYESLDGKYSLEYQYINGGTELSIVGYAIDDEGTAVDIPSEIEGKKVKQIKYALFYGCDNIISVTIPDTVTEIEPVAFANCKKLETITIPASVTAIGEQAFVGTKWLADQQKENSLVVVNNMVVDGSTSTGDITIPSGITAICDGAFNIVDYSKNEHGTISEPENNNNLTSVTCNNELKSIGKNAFQNCIALTAVKLNEGIVSIDDRAFRGCSTLFSITIPEGVTNIGDNPFTDCAELAEISLPDSIKKVGLWPFGNTKWWKGKEDSSENGLVIEKHILLDGTKASGNVVIPDNVTVIADYSFCVGTAQNNTGLTGVDIKGDVEVIPESAFAWCNNIKSITLPDTVTSIEERAFDNCTGLESIILSGSLASIDDSAFINCTSLTSINVSEDNPSYSSADGVLYNKNKTTLVSYPAGKGGEYTIPETVTSIEKGALTDCNSLEEIVLNSNLTSISPEAFQFSSGTGSTQKIKVTVPEEMDVSGLGLENIQATDHVVIYVAEGSTAALYLEKYKLQITVVTYPSKNGNKEDEKKEDEKKEDEKKDTPANTPSDTSVGGGTDNTQEASQTAEIGKTYEAGSATYKVTSAAEVTFTAPKSKSIKKVTIPATVTIMNQSYNVTAISKGACKNCKKLTTVTVGSNVTSIGDEAFMNCAKLNKVTVGKNVTSIGKKTFSGDKKLKKLIFKGAKVKKVGKKALSQVPKKVKITAPKKAVSKYKKLLNKAK
ncbi:MAG: leucine-rich repeat protein [Lachnospiraceae bacterium]|nr:leucine-rich repeat protein [Lachnospiraceae bacterium]